MKKGKVILTAIALFAIIGGALAFKAQRFEDRNVFTFRTSTTTAPGGPVVPICGLTALYITQQTPGALSVIYSSTQANSVCTGLTTTLVTASND